MKNINRRKFLKGSGLFAGSSLVSSTFLSNAIFQGVMQKALAQVDGEEPLNYALINLHGAPPRWFFDLPLEAVAGSGLHNPFRSFGNCFREIDGQLRPDYRSLPFKNGNGKTFHLPLLWGQKVPTGSGQRSLSDLLEHSVFVRGINNLIDGHDINNQMLVAPQLTEETTLGYNSDASSRPFATVIHGYQTSLAHKGRRNGNAPVMWSLAGSKTVDNLLTPFTDSANIFNRRMPAGTDAKIEQALTAFHVYAEQHLKLKPTDVMKVQEVARANMKSFMAKSGELKTRWTETLSRYQQIVSAAIRPANGTMPFLNDKAVRLHGRPCDHVNGSYVVTDDLRTSVTSATQANSLAEVFALIEFLFVEGLSTTVCLAPGTMAGLTLDDLRLNPQTLRDQLNARKAGIADGIFTRWQNNELSYENFLVQMETLIKSQPENTAPLKAVKDAMLKHLADFKSGKPGGNVTKNTNVTMAFDQHTYGAMASIYHTTLYFRALGASLAELVDRLKAAKVFDRTLLHLAGDFNRRPRKDGTGSDHGFYGSAHSFYSGMVRKGPYVIGNIVKTYDHASNPGAWGVAAPALIRARQGNTPAVQRPIQPGDLGNSVSSVLGIPAVSTNGYSLFRRNPNTGLIEFYVTDCKDV